MKNPDSSNSIERFLPALLIIGLVVVAYLPIHQAGFIWDDDDYVTDNLTLRSVEGLVRIWTEPGAVPQYYPLVHTTFWVEYQLWGLRAFGYHAVNVLLHAGSGALLWLLLGRLGLGRIALPAAALFAVHPVMVESVAWITERKNCLSLFFLLGAMLAAVRAWGLDSKEESPAFSWKAWSLASVLFLCALLSKTVVASFPAIVLVVLWWKRGRIAVADVLRTLPWFVVGGGLGLFTAWMEKNHVGAEGVDFDFDLADRIVIAGRACWFYAASLVAPLSLSFIYPRWDIEGRGALSVLWPMTAAALPLVLLALQRRIGRGPAAATLLFGGMLFPALGFIDVYPFVFSFVADHFQYHAAIPMIVLLVATGAALTDRLKLDASIPTAAASLLVGIATVLTFHQVGIYRNIETLWADTLRKNPDSWMPLSNMGLELARQGRMQEALPYFQRSLELRPEDAVSHYNVATAQGQLGNMAEAEFHYREALRLQPEYPQAMMNLANVLAAKGDRLGAIRLLRESLELVPENALGQARLGELLLASNQPSTAEVPLRKALELDPSLAATRVNLGNALASLGRPAEAVEEYRRALETTPNDPDTRFNLGSVLTRLGRNAEAAAEFEKVLEITPDDQDAARRLRDARAKAGRP